MSIFEDLIPQILALLRYQGVIVHSMADLPIGFGVAAKATSECRHADPMNIVAFHQVQIDGQNQQSLSFPNFCRLIWENTFVLKRHSCKEINAKLF